MKTVSVIHLIGRPYSMDGFKVFLNSYITNSANYPHDLIFLFNGFVANSTRKEFYDYARSINVKFVSYRHETNGSDLDAYMWVCSKLHSDYVLFFNSYSEILHTSWLLNYMKAIVKNGVGVVGASCSCQSLYSTLVHEMFYDKNKNLWKNFCKLKYFIKKYLKYSRVFPKFPNPHFRTNAFIISRELMLSFKFTGAHSKDQAYKYESGKTGWSNQVLGKGLSILVMDKNGEVFYPNEWHLSKTFWAGQENLLVEDNRTRDYTFGIGRTKDQLTYLAWGIIN